jgi:hypothetical protein
MARLQRSDPSKKEYLLGACGLPQPAGQFSVGEIGPVYAN